MLWWPSTSSSIYNCATGAEIYGVRGQRLYLILRDARDIERAGKALLTYLWAEGFGRFEVSKSGALLERGLFDASVWQSNRIDFAAGAQCTAPLEQRRGPPIPIEGTLEFIDSAVCIPEPSADVKAGADANRAAAREKCRPTAERIRDEWVEHQAEQLVKAAPETGVEEARANARRALEQRVLPGDWPLTVEGRHVSVADVLDNRAKYHGKHTLDPIEPDYDGAREVGKLFLYGARPNLFSFAHGGANYRLERQPARIELVRGRDHDTVNAFLDVLRREPDIFDYGDTLVAVEGARLHALNDYALRHWLGGAVQCYTVKVRKEEVEEVLEDPPLGHCRAILALGPTRHLKPLTALLTAPTLRPDGTLLAKVGYDDATGLLLAVDPDEIVSVPEQPAAEQAAEALDALWKPFVAFPFVSPLDRAAHLAAILTAVVRASLPTAPAFAYDAPSQGSGKTLLARCVAAIAAGGAPDVWPPARGRDDEEMRKRIFTALAAGHSVVLLDNLVGIFDSPSLAAAITSDTYSDRVLGKSVAMKVPNRTLFLMSGNNLSLSGDMPRRVLTCRIDPKTDTPFARQFDLDPEAYCRANRQHIVAAALTLLRFHLAAGSPRLGTGRMAAFEQWDDMVRQAILYVDRELTPGRYGDVMELARRGQESDPEREDLLRLLSALRGVFGARSFSTSDVAEAAASAWRNGVPDPARKALAEALEPFRHGSAPISSVSMGRVLANRKGRIVDGLSLASARDPNANATRWRVVDEGRARAPVVPIAAPWAEGIDPDDAASEQDAA